MKKVILNIEGMTCSACSNGLEKYLNKQNGVISANVNLVMATAQIEYDENLSIKDLERFVKEAGFKSLGEQTQSGSKKNELKKIIIFSILAIFLMYISMGDMLKIPIIEIFRKHIHPIIYTTTLIAITTLFIIWGLDIIKNGIKNIIHKMPNMDSLVGVGVIVNFMYSLYNSYFIYKGDISLVHNLYFESSAMIILFIKIGRYIDKKNKAKAVDTVKNLVKITPKYGTIIKGGKSQDVTINEIQKGDIVISKPGEKISVDGIITKGKTHTDESFLTGESNPVSKNIGDNVMAGSINYDGYIEYEAINIGKDSNISHIVDLVVEATNTKAPIERIADRISRYFVPIIFILSAVSFILNIAITKNYNEAINALVSVLVVACPCSLGLATPLAMVVSIGNLSKKGILVKSSEIIERANKINTVIFDKTGTLTNGKMEICDYRIKEDCIKLLQSLEAKSNHPIAKSIGKNAKDLYEVTEFEEISGFGIKGRIDGVLYFAGNRKFVENQNIENIFQNQEIEYSQKGESIVYFWKEHQMLGIFGLRDEIKSETKELINNLKRLNKKVVMLTGDNKQTAKIIAEEIGIEKIYSNVSPKQKLEIIEGLNKNQNILMVGDGVNDSPALKKASIGVSVKNGTDISIDSSDVMLMKDNMSLIDLFNVGKKTLKIIKQNLFWALFYNLSMVPLATGLLPIKINPMIASLAMTISSLTVVLNSLRLKNI